MPRHLSQEKESEAENDCGISRFNNKPLWVCQERATELRVSARHTIVHPHREQNTKGDNYLR